MATIQEVAKHAGVGVATVSRVLNGSGYVKESTKEKIMQSIKELDYTPNEMAKNLYHNRTGIVAVIVPEVSHPFFAEFVNAVEIALCSHGYRMMLCNTWQERNYERQYLEMLKKRQVDGIIFGAHTLDISDYQSSNRPIVALDRNLGPDIPCVSVDHKEGGRIAAELLIEAGCKNLVQVSGDGNMQSPSNDRHSMFQRVCTEKGILSHGVATSWNRLDFKHFEELSELVMTEFPDADGFFATDAIMLCLMRAAAKRGKMCGRDYKAVAYDGTYLSTLTEPSLTTIVQPINQLAEECVRLIVCQIAGRKTEDVHIKVSVRKGASTEPFAERERS